MIPGLATILCGVGVIIGGFLVPSAAAIAIPAGIGMVTGGIGLLRAKAVNVTGVANAQDPAHQAFTPTTKIDAPIGKP
jgi:hypothetical protein